MSGLDFFFLVMMMVVMVVLSGGWRIRMNQPLRFAVLLLLLSNEFSSAFLGQGEWSAIMGQLLEYLFTGIQLVVNLLFARDYHIVDEFMLSMFDRLNNLLLALFRVVVGDFKSLWCSCLHRFVQEMILNLRPDKGNGFQRWRCDIQSRIFSTIDGRNVAADQKIVGSTLFPGYWLVFDKIFIFCSRHKEGGRVVGIVILLIWMWWEDLHRGGDCPGGSLQQRWLFDAVLVAI